MSRPVFPRRLGATALPTVLRPTGLAPRLLEDVVARVPAVTVDGDIRGLAVTGVTHDSRTARPGDLYAALPGEKVHGAEFASMAAASGATALLTDRPGPHVLPALIVDQPRRHLGAVASFVYGEPSAALDVIGITGTNGKTTTSYLVEAGFAAAGRRTGLIGTVETRVVGDVVPSAHTTPEATDLHALLAVMAQRGATGVAMEVSSHGLSLGRVDGVRYAAAVFTNLSQDHLDFHLDMESYFKAKALLFAEERSALAVINVDDAAGLRLLDRVRTPLVTTSARGSHIADWRATDVTSTTTGTTFTLHAAGVSAARRIEIGLPGSFNVDNALSALAALHSVGVDLDAAIAGVEGLIGVPGRMERVDCGQPWLAVVDYAHTPDSVASVLTALRPLTPGRLVVVLGCGGDRDRAKRPLMGEAAARHGDLVIITSDNPRSEDPQAIVDDVEIGARAANAADVVIELDRAAAIAIACRTAAPGDTVIVAGKGHEQGQIFADHTVPFDDCAVLRAAIAAVLA